MSKTQVTLNLTATEIQMLKHALEVQVDITADICTDPLFVEKDVTTISVEQLNEMRKQVDSNIDRMIAADNLFKMVRDL